MGYRLLLTLLLLKSRYIPRLLAGWGVFASRLFATHALLLIVFPGAAARLQFVAYVPMGLYEVSLGFWLLLKGAKIHSNPASRDAT